MVWLHCNMQSSVQQALNLYNQARALGRDVFLIPYAFHTQITGAAPSIDSKNKKAGLCAASFASGSVRSELAFSYQD